MSTVSQDETGLSLAPCIIMPYDEGLRVRVVVNGQPRTTDYLVVVLA